jgi:hypothetical protein
MKLLTVLGLLVQSIANRPDKGRCNNARTAHHETVQARYMPRQNDHDQKGARHKTAQAQKAHGTKYHTAQNGPQYQNFWMFRQ